MRWTPLSLLLLCSCAAAFVKNEPHTVLFERTYDEQEARFLAVRALQGRKLSVQGEAPDSLSARSSRASDCSLMVKWTATQAVVTAEGNTSPRDPGLIDSACSTEAVQLAKRIQSEITRPEREARKAAKRELKREQAAAQAAAWAAQAEAQREAAARALAEQAATLPPAPPEPQPRYDPPPQQVTSPQPARSSPPPPTRSTPPPPAPVVTTTVVRSAPPPPAAATPQVTLKGNTCCVQGRAYLCPNTTVYAAACVQRQGDLASLCPNDPAHNQFCPR